MADVDFSGGSDQKDDYGRVNETDISAEEVSSDEHDRTSLHRGLESRHISMIAIGGALGTGLLIGTGKTLAQAGPGSLLISYTFVGSILYLVMCALGEMSAWIPLASGFTGFAVRYCDPALGFALGYIYWIHHLIITPNQMTAGALVIQYWVDPDDVNPGVFITIFLVVIICVNYFGGVGFFGEFEFWLSSFKVIAIVAIILLSLILACGYRNPHPGFDNWKHPGAFNTYIATGSAGRFYAFWSSLVNAVFAFLGTELVGVTVGEAKNPRKAIPKAIKLTFFRIVFFYILSVFFLGMIVPYNSPELGFANKSTTGAAASPFVVAVKIAKIHGLDHVINAAILVFVFSAANSDLYIATRTLYGLASERKAPQVFARTDRRGVPFVALGTSSLFGLLGYLNVSSNSKKVFTYFVNMVAMFGLLAWISILISHIWFVRAMKAQNVPATAQAYRAPLGMWGSVGALFFCILIALTKNFGVFTGGRLDTTNFITGYIGIPIYLTLLLGYKTIARTKGVRPETADLFSGKDKIDREEEEYVAQQAAWMERRRLDDKRITWYKFISWLF